MTQLFSGAKVKHQGEIKTVLYHIQGSSRHPSYMVMEGGEMIYTRDVKLLRNGPRPYSNPVRRKRRKLLIRIKELRQRIRKAVG